MYIIKNAYRNITRSKGRNILIGIIITIVTLSCCITLTIRKSAETLQQSYKDTNPLEIGFNLDPMSLKSASTEEIEAFETLTIDSIKSYGDSTYVSDYYYTLETNLFGKNITAIDYSEIEVTKDNNTDQNRKTKFGNTGDFRLTAYSDFSYLLDFINGTKKITEGTMIDKNNTNMEIVISEDLATENNLKLGDSINLYNSTDEDTLYTFKIIGIYKDNSNIEENSFMNMNAMNSRNQLYTNLTSLNTIISASTETTDNNTKQIMSKNGLTAKFYLKDASTMTEFVNEVKKKGLSSFYQVTTNEETVLSALKPIQNVSNYATTFLIVILIVGAIILIVLQMINIRERKYEIGVLRAIGMSKFKVTIQLVSEIFIVSLISLLIGTGIGTVLSQPVTNQMLESEISSYQEKLTVQEQNFGGGNFNRPGQGEHFNQVLNTTNIIDSLTVSTDIKTILQLVLVSIVLTILSGSIAVMFVNQYEPNKILQNRA